MSASPPALDQDSKGTSNITKICQNGDVILAVGPKEKIRVASDFLKHISPVFKAMLDGPMSEGEALRNKPPDSPIIISLPEDSPVAMIRLLRILYGANDFDPTFEAFYDVIILADKYAMTERLKHFGFGWVRVYPLDKEVIDDYYRGCWEKLVTSYILNDNTAFFHVSSCLSNSAGVLVDWATELPNEVLGLRLALAIGEICANNLVNKERQRMRLCLDRFKTVKGSFLDKGEGCEFEHYHRRLWDDSW
ncbi:hypothetical protein FGSG_04048 [Fusarium graminearum PH-1]|uniref:Chromosome 2, complete genome n=1 Tax=Gibberella zeae (strain ATCC MYA-4620 / CBS 123657 / FGSC 9075 / NRRL 31084 / PH-1) TaxID=229533 RepID=I1RJM3_GIBZE|nr:hypothetical protein FGSG_04048 [Fusarium graminearum PH-1]ESU09106.1 hypothetical protein FGSG_04048 [Fusarium graminearum PH-1]CEF78970.1 unnamed protein product [Fusarium graminearum]|eukprot:XP_011321605.1 hypothetical protein FGSG_04048 [Fusarium graminearum PH-1]